MTDNNRTTTQNVADGIIRGLREFADALSRDEVITEKFTCRKVTLDLRPIPYPPEAVRATRGLLRVSQAMFAQFLGVKKSAVQAWEQGRNTPNDMACRFMDEIQRAPEYWRKRLRESICVKEPC